ncbi:MAG: prephenate dehydrogenase [Deltaproteobacteria bacterium]|nr:prephenate dehydrogenase [Deltaproteobacteria bacterium]
MFKEIKIIGLGFMGASLAGAVKGKLTGTAVKGYDIVKNNIDYCIAKGIIDEPLSLDSGYNNAASEDSLVIMCVPPSSIVSFFDKYADFFGGAALITDIGSVKALIGARAKKNNLTNFVGSHPMCGSDKSGPENADFSLFDAKKCIVIKEKEDYADKDRSFKIEKIAGFWKSLNMEVIFSEAETHDEITAYTSHLPHLAAFLLSDTTLSHVKNKKFSSYASFIGGGFKDSTRIASSSPDLWTDIFLMNDEKIIFSLDNFIASANYIKSLIETGDRNGLVSYLKKIYEDRKEAGI